MFQLERQFDQCCNYTTAFVVKVPDLQKALPHTHCQPLPIPQFINTYNYHMNGADIAGQLRAVYKTHLGMRRNWMCLFFWLLDTTIVNAFLLRRCHLPSALTVEELSKISPLANNHKAFRQSLVITLLKPEIKRAEPLVVGKNHLPMRINTSSHIIHRITCNQMQRRCYWCQLKKKIDRAVQSKRSSYGCAACGVQLCRDDCFDEFHTSELAESEAEGQRQNCNNACSCNKIYDHVSK